MSRVILPATKILANIYALKLNLLWRLKTPPENETFIQFPVVYLATPLTETDCMPHKDTMITE